MIIYSHLSMAVIITGNEKLFYIKSVRSFRIASVLLRKTVRRSPQIANVVSAGLKQPPNNTHSFPTNNCYYHSLSGVQLTHRLFVIHHTTTKLCSFQLP